MRVAAGFGFCLTLLLCCPAHSQQRSSTADAFREFVTALPAVDRVEVLDVSFLQTDDVTTVDCTRRDLVCAAGRFPLKIDGVKTLSGESAIKLSASWRKLKQGTRSGCFTPTHVFRFYEGERLLLSTEVSFFGPMASLPEQLVVSFNGSMQALYELEALVIPDSARHDRFEDFKREMMPLVDRQVSIIGTLGFGKLGLLVSFRDWLVWIYSLDRPNNGGLNYLDRFNCHVVKVTGTLRYFPKPPPRLPSEPIAAVPPEHFYFELAEAKVTDLSPPPAERSKRKPGKKYGLNDFLFR